MNVRIFNAASMFYASPTGRQLRGDADIKTLVRRVVLRLKREVAGNEISFSKMPATPGGIVDGLSRKGWSGFGRDDILINKRLVDNIAATSLTLVHEAAHLELRQPYIEEELWCRTLAVYYLNDLAYSSAVWDYPTYGGGRATATKLHNPASHPADTIRDVAQQLFLFAGQKLLDHILSMKEYANSLTAGWIRTHFHIYGGIANRTNETKGLYIRVLANSGGVANARLILQILQSVPSEADWIDVAVAADVQNSLFGNGVKTVRKGLAPLRAAGGTAQDAQTIKSLEAMWHASL
jgi:hypothetical protein